MKQANMASELEAKAYLYRWLVFATMALAYLLACFHRVCPSVVGLDIQQALGLSGGLTGLMASAYFYSYAFIQFPAGLLSDSLGPRASVSIFLVVGGLGSILLGLAVNLEMAILGRVLVGLGAGMIFTATMKILSHWFRLHEFSRMNAIFLIVGGLGTLTGAEPMAWLNAWLGWRVSFGIIGLITALLGALVWALVRNKPSEMGWPPVAEIDRFGVNSGPGGEAIPLWAGVRQVVFSARTWPMAGWAFLTMGSFFGFGGLWAGPYLMQVYGLSQAEAGGILNMLAVGIIVGAPIHSFISEKILHSRKWVLFLCSCALAGVLTIFNLYPSDLSVATLYVLTFAFALFALAPGVIGVTTTKELFPIEITGTSVGIVNLFPFMGAGMIQLLLGWVLESYPRAEGAAYSLEAYKSMLLVMLLVGSLSIPCALLMKETFKRKP
ncbi:MAG: MFS transporter [Thermodesulfobacteriota bacterium]